TALYAKESAMRADAQAGTHPVIQHVTDVLDAGEAFDTITYQKGQSTIRMLEDYVGPVAFRAGVRNYMKKYAYRNTVTDDLWREIDKVSPHSLSVVAHDFTLQDGVPMVAASATATGLHLSLGHFERDGAGAPRRWLVPVTVTASDGKPIWQGLVSTDRPADVAVPQGVVAIVNAGQSGYFRTRYDDVLMGRITTRFNALSADDQFGILNDAWALGEAGLRPMADGLALARLARADMDPIVQQAVAQKLASLVTQARGLPVQASLRRYAVNVLQPLLAPLGTHKRAGENDNVTMLRGTLIEALSVLGDPAVIAEASTAFKDYLANPGSLQGDDRDTVFAVVALNATAEQWQQLQALAARSTDTLEQRKLYHALAAVRDEALAAKTLELALQDPVPLTLRPDIVRAVSADHPEMAYDFAIAHKAAFDALLEPDSRALYFPSLALSAQDPAMVAKLDQFVATGLAGRSSSRIEMVKATIRHTVNVRQQHLPDVASWLDPH
ncbi:MAG: M1 family metallopeptidase, partial [Rhizomicrobium sp.]